MKMVFIKVKLVTLRNTDLENIISKMETIMKDKCIKE